MGKRRFRRKASSKYWTFFGGSVGGLNLVYDVAVRKSTFLTHETTQPKSERALNFFAGSVGGLNILYGATVGENTFLTLETAHPKSEKEIITYLLDGWIFSRVQNIGWANLSLRVRGPLFERRGFWRVSLSSVSPKCGPQPCLGKFSHAAVSLENKAKIAQCRNPQIIKKRIGRLTLSLRVRNSLFLIDMGFERWPCFQFFPNADFSRV